MNKKVLCVDDDPNILDAYRRGLRKQFELETAAGGAEGLETVASRGPFAVVVSDMRMPGMDGVRFLSAVKERAADTVRIMLTGNADQQTAIDAVNEGSIFRFLTKPCLPEQLAKALTAGIEQYRLVTAEKELLSKTLRGAIKVLNDVLALSNPTAFGHASRVRRVVKQLCEKLKVPNAWECEVAAMLSQIGCVTIPPETLDKVHRRQRLSPDETEMLRSHPAVGRDLVANIPRLEGVAQIIAFQDRRFDEADALPDQDLPLGARILKAALDYDAAKWSGMGQTGAVAELRRHAAAYDPEVLAALESVTEGDGEMRVRELALRELTVGMSLAADVKTVDGMVVVARGQKVTPSLCERIKNFGRHRDIEEPIRVIDRVGAATAC